VNDSSRGAPTDEELLDRARGGEDRAFGLLVERYEGVVASTVIGMLGPGDEAEDVGQETFIRFHRALERFRGDSSLTTYLTRIAINLSLTAIRRRRRWSDRFKGSTIAAAHVSSADNPEAELDRSLRSEWLWGGIQRLSSGHRAVVVLRMIDGYSTRETSRILGVPEGTVMSRLARAMERLESHLKETDR
jgi:RNA polymerase sigma-70 factor (ECF subfamily)